MKFTIIEFHGSYLTLGRHEDLSAVLGRIKLSKVEYFLEELIFINICTCSASAERALFAIGLRADSLRCEDKAAAGSDRSLFVCLVYVSDK